MNHERKRFVRPWGSAGLGIRRCFLGLSVAVATAVVSQAEGVVAMRFPLASGPEGVMGGRPAVARLPGGAAFLLPAEGGGVRPGREEAVVLDVPAEAWHRAGSLGLQVRPSRTLRFRPPPSREVNLADGPLFRAVVRETERHLLLIVEIKTVAGEPARRDSIAWSRLDDRWYHFVLAWDADAGAVELYLNGTPQERLRNLDPGPWTLPGASGSPLALGGVMAVDGAWLGVRDVVLRDGFPDEASVAVWAREAGVPPVSGEGRTVHGAALDLSGFRRTLVYETDFREPLSVVAEDALFEGGERVRRPGGVDWVLEGEGAAWTEGGRLHVRNDGHTVLWNTREFPEDFLLEFGFSREREDAGLAIVFFNTRARDGGDIFAPGLPRRAGDFRTYHSGALNGYHLSYVTSGRRTANLRKNAGFFMPAVGNDRVHGYGEGPHRIRILKVGGRIALETNGEVALLFEDDGQTYGPAWMHAGHIGLRQMANMGTGWYTHLRVWRIDPQ